VLAVGLAVTVSSAMTYRWATISGSSVSTHPDSVSSDPATDADVHHRPSRNALFARRALLPLVGVAVLVVIAVVAATVSETPTPNLLSATAAQEAYGSVFPNFEVQENNNPSLTGTSTTTTLLQQAITGYNGCACLVLPYGEVSYELAAPSESHYPLSFLATVASQEESGFSEAGKKTLFENPYEFILVFEKTARTSPWKVAHYIAYATTSDATQTLSEGFEPLLRSNLTSTYVFRSLAAALTEARSSGQISASNPWFPTYPSSEYSGAFRTLINQHAADVKYGVRPASVRYWVSAVSQPFVTPQGALVCATISGRQTYRSRRLVQPKNHFDWGEYVAPGVYSSITFKSTHDGCVLQTSPTGFEPLTVTGSWWGASALAVDASG